MLSYREMFVNVYNVQQAYGGPEEGGWYYDVGTPMLCLKTTCNCNAEWHQSDNDICPVTHCVERANSDYVIPHKEEYLESFITGWEENEDPPNEYRGEIATNGKCIVSVEKNPAISFPDFKPHYE